MSDSDTATPKTAKVAESAPKLGMVITAKAGAVVTRPDGTTHVVAGEGYVLDVPGTFVVNGAQVHVEVG